MTSPTQATAREAEEPQRYAEWLVYAKRAGLLDKDGVANCSMSAQTAYYAYTAAWNHVYPLLAAKQEEVDKMREALKPFAAFACSPRGECQCHNCIARDLLALSPSQQGEQT